MKWLLFLCLTPPLYGHTQKGDTLIKYLDADLNLTKKNKAVFPAAAIRQQDSWFVVAWYDDTSCVVKAYYKNKGLTIKEGRYELYYPNNRHALAGYYHDNRRTGVWRRWYENGQLKDSGFIHNDIVAGLWRTWYQSGPLKEEIFYKRDMVVQTLSPAHQPVVLNSSAVGTKHGPYRRWYESGLLEATGMYSNDSMAGRWEWYHETGKRSTVEEYRDGVITSLTCFDSAGNNRGDICSIDKPALLREYGDYRMYIAQNLVWPKDAFKKRAKGEVKVTFRVTKQGRLDQLVIDMGEPVLKKAVEQFFATMNDWLPAISHNRVIDSEEAITIPVQLEE